MKKKIIFIVNPHAGVDRLKSIETAIVKKLDLDKFDWSIAQTRYPKHGQLIAEEAVKAGTDVVVAVGGDGSLNDVIQSLAGTDTVLGIIPMGSGNGLARSAGIPLNLDEAIKVINKENVHAIDLGIVNDQRYFISNAGVGFDAVVTNEFTHSEKRGFWTYISIINKEVWTYQPQRWLLDIDGEIVEETAFMITVANATQLGYNFQIAPVALLNDGYFDVVIIRKHPKIFSGIIGLQAFTDTLLNNRFVKHYRAKRIKITNATNSVMQLDGDSMNCEATISIAMQAKKIRLLCP